MFDFILKLIKETSEPKFILITNEESTIENIEMQNMSIPNLW